MSTMANVPSDEQIGRLPGWAKTYIRRLERQADRLEKQVDSLSSGHEGSNVAISGRVGTEDQHLPSNSRINFFLGETRSIVDHCISIRHEKSGRGEPQLDVNASGTIHIIGGATNSIKIRFES